jgi:hypothetical protein
VDLAAAGRGDGLPDQRRLLEQSLDTLVAIAARSSS